MRSIGVVVWSALSVLCVVSALGCEGDLDMNAPDGAGPSLDMTSDLLATGDRDLGDVTAPDADSGQGVGEDAGAAVADMAPVAGPRWVDPLYNETFLTPNNLDQTRLFACMEPQGQASPSSLRRVGAKEWIRGAGFSFGSDLKQSPLATPGAYQYESYTQGLGVDDALLSLHLSIAPEASGKWGTKEWGYKDDATKTFARRVLPRLEDEGVTCFFEDAVSAECTDSFTRTYLELGVLHRPPSQSEFERVRDYAAKKLSEESGPEDRQKTVEAITTLSWLLPGALFRRELGEGEIDAYGRRRLGAWEMASALAYSIGYYGPLAPAVKGSGVGLRYVSNRESNDLLTTSPEGWYPELRVAAEEGMIWEDDFIEAFVRDHLVVEEPVDLGEDDGARKTARRDLLLEVSYTQRPYRARYRASGRLKSFFREWLGLHKPHVTFWDKPTRTSILHGTNTFSENRTYDGFRKNGASRGQVGQRDKIALNEQLDDMIAKIVHDERDFLSELLTTDRYFIGPHAAESDTYSTYYGFDSPPSHDEGWVTLPEGTRVGVLGHPAWLSAHSGNFENGPSLVFRGKWIYEQLLCETMPPPPEGAVVGLKPEHAERSARDRLLFATVPLDSDTPEEREHKENKCFGCHKSLNSLGFPFEAYNHAGLVRVFDRAEDGERQAPNSSSVLDFWESDGGLDDLSQLNGAVDSPQALAQRLANSPRVKRCFIRQTFRYFAGRPEQYADACTLQRMEQAYDERGSFIDMLVALLTSDTFSHRHAPILEEAP